MSDYKKLRKEQALQDIINNDPSFKKGEVKERPDEAIEFFRDSQYDLTKETIGREMNLVNGVIKAMQQRLSDPKQLRSIPTDDLMKAALSAVKIKSSIMGPDAYKYEVHFQKLQEKMEAVLEIINQEVEEETRLRIFERLQEMHMEEVRRGQDE